jgi:hypothetical protein
MQFPSLSNTLARSYRLRRLLEAERRRERQCSVRLLRLQALLLKAQERLAALLVPRRRSCCP